MKAKWPGLVVLVALVVTSVSVARGLPTSDPLSAKSLFAGVVRYARLGPVNHLTGSRSDARVQAWIGRSFAFDGLRVGVDGYSYFRFRVRRVDLVVAGRRYLAVAPYYYSGSTGPHARRAQLAYAGEGTPAEVGAADVRGKLAVITVPYVEDALDPTFSPAFASIERAGAVGLIAVTEGPQDYPVYQDVDSRAGVQKLPTLFIGKRSGQQVIAAAQAHKPGSLLLDASSGRDCTINTYGVLPGLDRRRFVFIGTPTGAWVQAASERGAGVAILLGLAAHYAEMPISQRPLTLIFVALSGHELGYLGLPTFMATHPQWFNDADAYVHLGASLAAYQQVENQNGTVTKLSLGDPTRDLYVSENPLLQPGVQKAFAPAQPLGSIAPGVFDPGEQGYAYHNGIPIVAESGASYYFHTAGDHPDGVSPQLLVGQAQGFAGSIDYVTSLPAGALRAANGVAAQLGARTNPNPTPTGGSAEHAAYFPQFDPSCARIATLSRGRRHRTSHRRLRRGRRRPPSFTG